MAKKRENDIEAEEDKILMDIEKYGWTIIQVEGTDYLPTFAYTIGLHKNHNHPEIIAFGLDAETLFDTLAGIGTFIQEWEKYITGKNYPELFEESRTEFVNVAKENIEDYFGYAVDFYETSDFPAIELVWSDDNNLFPWEKGYNKELEFSQPLLDRNTDFKFMEDKNLKVFASADFLEKNTPIVEVLHNEEGEWYFLTDSLKSWDLKNVSLGELVKKDPSLNEFFSLDYGEKRVREIGVID